MLNHRQFIAQSLAALAIAGLCLLSRAAEAVPQPAAYDTAVQGPRFDHIVVIVMENEQPLKIIGSADAPYTTWLAEHGANITGSYGCEHPSQPNYFDLFSGGDQNIYSDKISENVPFSGPNLGAQLLHAGLSFAGYSEDLPYAGALLPFCAGAGSQPGTQDYARKHNPWCNWQNDEYPASPANSGSNYLPASVNQSFTAFQTIAADGDYGELPTLSFVIPNQQHDQHGVPGGHKGSLLLRDGDDWLKAYVDGYAQWALGHNSLLILTYDEDDFSADNHIPTVFFGAHVRPGSYSESQIRAWTSLAGSDLAPSGPPVWREVAGVNHWNMLRTLEELCGLPSIGMAAQSEPIRDVFDFEL